VTAPWPIAVHPTGLVSSGTLLWRYRGALHCTVVVKASWTFDPSGQTRRSDAEPVYREWGEGGGEPRPASSDLAPHLAAAELWLEGNARSGRVALFGAEPLLDRRLEQGPLGLTPPPERVPPFTEAQRQRLAEEPLELDDGFSWQAFHAVAAPQRIPYLNGGERLLLEGLIEGVPTLVALVPSAAARAYVYVGMAPLTVAAMTLDGLGIDSALGRMTLRWRGGVAIGSHPPAEVSILVGVESAGETLDWAAAHGAMAPPSLRRPPVSVPAESVREVAAPEAPPASSENQAVEVRRFRGTMRADAGDAARLGPALPFRSATPEPEVAPSAKRSRLIDGTMPLSDATARQRSASLPFQRVETSAPKPLDEQRAADIPGAPWARGSSAAAPGTPGGRVTVTAASEPGSLVRIVNATSAAAVAFPWKLTDRHVLTVVAKACFHIQPGGRAKLHDDPPVLCGDKRYSPRVVERSLQQERSLRHPSDYAVTKARADVVLVGHAYAPGGHGEAALATFRFDSRKGGFERRVAVFGDRRWQKSLLDLSPGRAEPFARMPLVYERAFGGQDFADNPVGVGYHPKGSVKHGDPLPNLEDPDALIQRPSDRPRPVCFGPLARHWGAHHENGQHEPWDSSFPETFDWSTFQVAPVEQQLERIDGDERFECLAMHVKHSRLEAWLPGLRLRSFADYGEAYGGGFRELAMKLDTVLIEPDELRLTLLWRHAIDVCDARAPEIRAVFLAFEDMAQRPAPLNAMRERYLRGTT
jgi:hypothetical protein